MNNIYIKTGEIVGIIPSSFSDKHPILHRCFYIFYILLICAIYFYWVIASLNESINSPPPGREFSRIMLAMTTFVLFGIFVISALLINHILYIKQYKIMKITFREIDNILQPKPNKLLRIITKYVIFHALYFAYEIYRYTRIISNDFTIIFYLLGFWLDYVSVIDIVVAYNILNDVRNRLKYLNRIITSMIVNSAINKTNQRLRNERKVYDLIEVHTKIIKIIHIFNRLYGTRILILNFTYVIDFLSVVSRVVSKEPHDIYAIIFDFFYAAFSMVCCVYKKVNVFFLIFVFLGALDWICVYLTSDNKSRKNDGG